MPQSSSTVVRIYDVLLTIFPDSPTDRAIDDLQETILGQLRVGESRDVIIGLSNVEIMDSFFARTISETAQMIRLMGGTPIIVGIQPSVALIAAELGYNQDDVETARTTDQALEMLGQTMVEL